MNDSSQTGFQDKFDGTVDLQASWYRIQGGQVDIDCLSMDTALMFSENTGMCHQTLLHLYESILQIIYGSSFYKMGAIEKIRYIVICRKKKAEKKVKTQITFE